MSDADQTYRTFKRSATSWREFAGNPKVEVDTGLTLTEARDSCKEFNDSRSADQIENGTMLEFERE